MIRGHTRGTCNINDLLYLLWGTAKEHARQAGLHGDLTVNDLGTDFMNRALESLSGEELTQMLTVGTGGGDATALLLLQRPLHARGIQITAVLLGEGWVQALRAAG